MEDDETVHNLLIEVGLPSTLHGLKNPTEEFVTCFIVEFLRKFYVDVNEITRLTIEQLEALTITAQENAPICSVINLREVMSKISPQLHFKEFLINDITSPAPKRTRRCLKLMANFSLYARNKKVTIQSSVDKVLSRGPKIQSLKKEKEAKIESMNEKAERTANKVDAIERIINETEVIQSRLEKLKKKALTLGKDTTSIEERKNTLLQKCQKKRIEVQKNQDKNDILRSKVVKSPGKYESKLKALEHEYGEKHKERDIMQEAILNKKPLIQNLEFSLNFIEQEHAKLSQFNDAHKRLNQAKVESEKLKTMIEETVRTINREKNPDKQDQGEQIDIVEVKKTEDEVNHKLTKLKSIVHELTNEKKLLESNREDLRTKEIEIYVERDKMKAKIIEVEKETKNFLKQCQQIYSLDREKLVDLHGKIENGPDI